VQGQRSEAPEEKYEVLTATTQHHGISFAIAQDFRRKIMKSTLLLIVVLASCAAQAQQPANCLQLKKVKIADHVLHQEGATWAELTLKAKDCSVVEEHDRTTVTFASRPGLDVTPQDIGFKRSDDESGGNPPASVKEVTVTLRLIASPDLPLGESTMHGMLTYLAVNGAGAVSPETLAFDIPLKVAPPKPYKPHDEPSAFMKGLKQTGVIALEAIVVVPVMLFMLIYCPISGECPTC
jgi:hypothetical protein